MKKKRGVLSLWAMLLIVLGAFVGVTGVVALIMFLTGQFNEVIIEPQDLIVSLYEGSEGYDDGEGHFYVANDFKLVINTTTEDVTEKKIKLKFDGDYLTRNGYITDTDNGISVMTMPEIVEIGKPFTVTLERQYSADVDADVVVGGIKSLTAESVANVELEHLPFTIAVDVPVTSIDVGVEQGQSTVFDDTQTVTIGSTFDFRVNFKPENSKYVFADNAQQKEYFYDFSSSSIRRNWQTGHFVAYAKNGSADEVTVYTFKNSYYRYLALKEIEESYADQPNLKDEDPEQYNIAMLNYFAENPMGAVSKTFQIQVVDVTVNEGSVQLKNGDSNETVQLDPVYVDKYFTLTTNSLNGDDTLGITVRDTGGEEKPYLVANVGIKMPEVDGLVIEGDKVMRVTNSSGDIEELQFDLAAAKRGEYKSTEEYSHYILPSTTPKESGDYFWRFNATAELSTQTFAINFFYENEAGKLVSLYKFGAGNEKSATLTITAQDVETPPYWEGSTPTDIKMEITYDSEGKAKTAVVDLNEYLAPLTSTNIYDVVRYFLVFGENTDTQKIGETFPFVSSHKYKQDYKNVDLDLRATDLEMPADGYTFYELEGSLLYALKSFSGKVYAVAATVQTNADHDLYLTADGAYKIVNISTPKAVIVESALSIVNMQPSFLFVDGRKIEPDEKDGNYYIPAISRSASGSSLDMISFELKIDNVEDGDATSKKVIEAFQNKKLSIECLDAQNNPYDVDYLQLETLTAPTGVAGDELVFTGRIVINETAFTEEHLDKYTNLDLGTPIKLRLVYNNGIENQYKDMTLKDTPEVSSFYVYYPQPYFNVKGTDGKYYIEGEYKNYFTQPTADDYIYKIIVNIDSTVSITWGDTDISTLRDQLGTFNDDPDDDAIEILNKLLTFTLKDQHGREIAEGLYNIRLVEEDADGNVVNTGAIGRSQLLNQIVNLSPTPDGEPTYLRAYVVENAITENGDNYFVKAYDEGFAPMDYNLGSLRFMFDIKGKGIDHVDFDNTTTIADVNAASWTKSPNNGTVTVRKVIVPAGDTAPVVNLADLVRVYKTGEGNGHGANDQDHNTDQTGHVEDLNFRVDAEWLAMLSNQEDLAKMLQFNGNADLTLTSENIENTDIVSISFQNVFRSDTELRFIITDSTNLFKINLEFYCVADVTIGSNFINFSNEYSEYLVSNTSNSSNAIFANHDYKLDDFTVFNSSHAYNWEDGFAGKENDTDEFNYLFESSNDDVAWIEKINDDIYLRIAENVYSFTPVTIYVYYKINSAYSPRVYLNLYINPNIIVQETLPQGADGAILDLAQWGSAFPTFETNFKFYLAFGQNGEDGYINKGSFEGLTPIDVTGLRFDFSGNAQYIAINETETMPTGSGKYKYNLSAGTLDLSFGQQIAQSFSVSQTTNSSDFNAIRIISVEGSEDVIFKSQEALELKLYITYAADASQIFAQDVQTVLYGEDKQTYVIMTMNNSGGPDQYTAVDQSITFEEKTSGAIRSDGQRIQVYGGDEIPNFVKYDNSIVAIKPLVDGEATLNINLTINIIASTIGDKFLYYDGQFNHFGDVPFSVLMSSSADLAKNNVSQKLNAGDEYKIVHPYSRDSIDDKEGFYFYSNGGYSITLDIVDDSHNIATLKKSEGNDTLTYNDSIALGNLEAELGDVYVTLRLSIKQSRNTLTYYYRIKVEPNFTKGEIRYPFEVEDGEYLDASSRYYDEDDGVYEINLNEAFDDTNSYAEHNVDINKYGKRFTDPVISGKDLTYSYKIGNLYDEDISSTSPLGGDISQYLTSEISDGETPFFDGDKLNIGLVEETRKLTVEIIKSFKETNGAVLVGGDLVYKLRFNQGRQYSYQITAGEGAPGVTPQRENVNTYRTTLTAGVNGEVKFNIKLAEKNGQAETDITDYYTYVAILGNVDKEILKDKITVEQDNKQITITTPDSITEDFDAEIGFYTSQKRVFKFVVSFTSNLKISPNEIEFVGGKTYKFNSSVDGTESPIFNTNASYTISGQESDFYVIDNSKIEFAHLTEDKDFTFTARHTSGYSFDFTITVKASIDIDALQSTSVVDENTRYGQVEFKVELKDVLVVQELSGTNGTFTFADGSTEQTITPEDVAVDGEVVTTQFMVVYIFNGKQTDISYTFTYQYTVDKNVDITVNYPMPDGETQSAREYLSSKDGVGQFSGTLKEFFNGNADFSDKMRVDATIDKDIPSENLPVMFWTINIKNLENLNILYNGSPVGVGSDIITHIQIKDAGSLKFELINTGIDGSAEFLIEINKVPVTYLLTVVSGDNIKIQRNMPDSDGGTEIIYAENMQTKGADIFESNRILKYQFASAAYGTYYVKLYNETESKTEIVPINVAALEREVNLDLGDSKTGFKYAGTYRANNAEGNREDDSSIYVVVPRLTSRIVASYSDDTVIKNGKVTLKVIRQLEKKGDSIGWEDIEGEKSFKLKTDDLNNDVEVAIQLMFNDTEISTSVTYVYRLTVDFEVANNTDTITQTNGAGAFSVQIKAGTSGSLLNDFNAFAIRRKSDRVTYTSAIMNSSVGRMQLKLYGLEEMPIDTSDELSKSALYYHEYLQNRKNAKGAKNLTGLMPIAGATKLEQGVATGGNGYTYVTRVGASGSDENASEYDFTITANGAGNDGNFVMMRLSYIVEFAGLKLVDSHNILFEVVPDSTIAFKEGAEHTAILGADNIVNEEGHSVWTNIDHPYTVDNNGGNDQIMLWNKDSESGSAIQAKMYNKSTLSAKDFEYTYDKSVGGGYNDWTDMENSFKEIDTGTEKKVGANISGNGTKWSDMGTGITSTATPVAGENFTLNVPNLSFGTTKFYIEFENEYGFIARFYFQKSSKLNPIVSGVGDNNTLTEGETFIFGADWNQVETDSNPTYTFTYDTKEDKSGTLNDGKLEITLTPGQQKVSSQGGGSSTSSEVPKTYTIKPRISITLGTDSLANLGKVVKKGTKDPEKEDIEKSTTTIGPSSILTRTSTEIKISDKQTPGEILFTSDSIDWELTGTGEESFTFKWNELWYLNGDTPTNVNTEKIKQILQGAEISVRFDISGTAGESNLNDLTIDNLDPIKVKFNSGVADKDQTPIRTYRKAAGGTIEADDATVVHMGGIDAFGFSKSQLTIDKYSAAQNFTSNFNDVLIERVDFYKMDGKTWLGSSIFGDNSEPTNGTQASDGKNVSAEGNTKTGRLGDLYTNSRYEFVTKNINGGKSTDETLGDMETGRKFESASTGAGEESTTNNNYFTVPYINGIEFGEESAIDVIMRVKIRGGKTDTNEQFRTTDFTVQINRADYADSTPASINDGDPVTTEVGGQPTYNFTTNDKNKDDTATWLNDTLEIELDPHETVTFAVHNKEITNADGKLKVDDQDFTAKLLTEENPNDFKITKYVSISGSMVDGAYTSNLDTTDSFYVYLAEDKIGDEDGNAVFKYNGNTISATKGESSTPQSIAQYSESSIKLRINDVRELTSGSKNVKLFFLKKMKKQPSTGITMIDGGNRIYRYSKVFNVVPKYSQATHGDLSADGQTLRIEDYYKVAENNTATSGFYYIIPMSVWGQKVNLTPTISGQETTLSAENAYKFEFEIENIRGSASIDKDGNIITASDFNPTWNQIGVTIREKVAGFDGNFEDGHGTLDMTSTSDKEREIIFSFVDKKAEETQKQSGAGSYYVTSYYEITNGNQKTQIDSQTLITLQGSEKLYATKNLSDKVRTITSVAPGSGSSSSFAVTPNQSLNLQEMFRENELFKAWTNVNFYIVGYAKGNGQPTTIIRNNIDAYEAGFAAADTYTITVIATGRTSSGATKQAQKFTATIYVYDTNNSTDLVKEIDINKASSQNLNTITGNAENTGPWYEIIGSTTKEYEKGTITVEEGINRRQFLLGNQVYNITFVGYSSVEKTTVATSKDFSLSNIVAGSGNEGGTFYSKNEEGLGFNAVQTEYFNASLRRTREETYYYQKGEKLTQYTVKYYYVSAEISNYNGILPIDGETHTVAKTDIVELTKKSLNITEPHLYKQDAYGRLIELEEGGETFSDDMWGNGLARYKFNYIVIWTSGEVENARQISLDCYLYQKFGESGSIEIEIGLMPQISYDLTNLISSIRTQVGAQDTDSVTFYEITNGVVNPNPTSQVVLTDYIGNEDGYKGEFWIRVGENYYKLSLSITVYTFEQEMIFSDTISKQESYDLSSLNERIKNEIGDSDGIESIVFYQITNGVVSQSPASQVDLSEYTENEAGFKGEFLVKVGDKYYKLNLTIKWQAGE